MELLILIDDFFQLDDVGVSEPFEESDLSDGGRWDAVIFFF